MSQKRLRLWLAGLLFLLLAATFLWCSLDIILGSDPARIGEEKVVNTITLLSAFIWVTGHSIHWAVVIVFPAVILWHGHFEELNADHQ